MAGRRTYIRTNAKGFTLVELVLVIVILGILAIATSKFIIFGTEIYLQATDRQHVLSKSRFLIERLNRELKASMPNSVRISADNACINFIPIKTSGAYRDDEEAIEPPLAPRVGTQLDVVAWNANFTTNDRFYIYPQNQNDVYRTQSQWGVIRSAEPEPAAPNYRVTFTRNNSIAYASPNKRFYTARTSVYYCVIRNNVYRYEQPSISSFFYSANLVSIFGQLMAEGVTNELPTEAPFKYREGALYRNSVVNLYFEFSSNVDENMFFNQEVHIPNVP